MPERSYIYGLFDSRIPDVIWYVGKSNRPENRLQYYRKDESNSPVYKWFRRLVSEGFEPRLRVLETCPFDEWKDRERFYIALHRQKNLLLLNKLDGGNGTGVKGFKKYCDACGTKRERMYPSDESFRCPICRKAQRRAYEAKWKADHPEYMPEYCKQYYLDNRDLLLARSRQQHAARQAA